MYLSLSVALERRKRTVHGYFRCGSLFKKQIPAGKCFGRYTNEKESNRTVGREWLKFDHFFEKKNQKNLVFKKKRCIFALFD